MLSDYLKGVLLLVVVAFAYADDDVNDLEDVESAELLQMLLKRGILDCKKKFEKCTGLPKCCGTMQCYWENGYSVVKSGVCVECVDRSQKCQRDSQCCGSLVCQKDDIYSVDGGCDVTRPDGGNCYRDSQCRSGKCEISWVQKIAKEVGKCK